MHAAAAKKRFGGSRHSNQRLKSDSPLKQQQNDSYIKAKVRKINDALDSDPVDVDVLRRLMVSSGGCITNNLRCKVWPKLLNINVYDVRRKKKADVEMDEFRQNVWWNQVNLDVDRSHRRFAQGIRVSRKRVLQRQLVCVIMRVLCRNNKLHYYQGYHDIAVTLLRVVGEDLATEILDRLSNTLIRDFMDKNMTRTNQMLSLFYPILAKKDPELERFLVRSEVGTIFALSWLITWYGHDINVFDVIVRLFDVFIATHPTMPVYCAVTMVLSHRCQIMERECEMSMAHHYLTRIPTYLDDVENVITNSFLLYASHPPNSLTRVVVRHIQSSDSIANHADLLYNSHNQRPDSILRLRKKLGHITDELPDDMVSMTAAVANEVNPLVKVAVWTMTVSMGVVTYLVLNTPKYWM